MAVNKSINVQFFDVAGTYIGATNKVSIGGFRKVINGGLGDLTISMAMTFSEAYESQYTQLMNRIKVIVVDAETPPEGLVMYSGLLIEREPSIQGNKQSVKLKFRGHGARFPFLPLKSGTTTLLRTDTANGLMPNDPNPASAAALDKVMKAIVDRYRAEAIYPVINYGTNSIEASARTWTYTLATKTLQYAIEKLMENVAAGTYWRVGADDVLYMKAKNPSADHSLVLGRHITGIQDRETVDGMANRFLFKFNGSPPSRSVLYQNTDSGNRFADWWDFKTDGRYSIDQEANNVGNSTIDVRKNPRRRTVITVGDSNGSRGSGYDIERFEPGETVEILNLPDSAQQNFPTSFQIMAVDWTLEEAILELDTLDDDLAREYARDERLAKNEEMEEGAPSYSLS